MTGPIFFQLACNVVYVALNLISLVNFHFLKKKPTNAKFEQCLPHTQNVIRSGLMMIEVISCIFIGIFWMFIYCYHATEITANLKRMGDIAYNSKWYDYHPMEVRKYIILMIQHSQIPFQFHGLHIFHCDLETFGNVRAYFWFISFQCCVLVCYGFRFFADTTTNLFVLFNVTQF